MILAYWLLIIFIWDSNIIKESSDYKLTILSRSRDMRAKKYKKNLDLGLVEFAFVDKKNHNYFIA